MPMDPALRDAFALFVLDGDVLVPQDIARSLWKADQMHGVATCGALGRAAERAIDELGRGDLQPARFTVDLFRAPSMNPCTTRVEVLREGSRIAVLEAFLEQDGEDVAAARVLFLKPGDSPSGEVWTSPEILTPPPLEIAPPTDDPRPPHFCSDTGWSQDFSAHQNAGRKQMWQVALPIVAGEETSPFAGLAGAADTTSMVMNWGSQGVEHINTDVTLSISRLPVSAEVGMAALTWHTNDGIATGTAAVYDREGVFGTSSVVSLANTRRSVDFTSDAVLGHIESA
ncbi:thioesterase [Nocardioides baekrokdamisoli]|uniref:Thioesterase n=1 Tax=Nocardioides baekrokdamisoli TaxID=1804624 RepID=A0A3G9IHG9_9ACTN|nr:thioesterase family protein [Nocardioides baekrokdamisoli]BBH18477.1 thioesterase [Nocardioides baekrokdamisoli]